MRQLLIVARISFLFALVLLLPAGSARGAGEDADLLDDLGAAPAPAAAPAGQAAAPVTTAGAEEIRAQAPGTEAKATAEAREARSVPAAQSLDRVKAVPRKPVLKRGRVELSLAPALSLNDAYYHHYAGNASLIYYLHDALGLGVGVDYMVAHVSTGNTDVIREAMTAVPAVFEPPQMFTHLDMYWVPIYGKA
ncbi:MAG: hypothetical protein AAB426_14135, partial [Myxococcota bacterium]